jgi:hypothetical protein
MHLLIDVDSKIPNLALMHISSWLKRQGITVKLIEMEGRSRLLPTQGIEKVWVSSIFKWNRSLSAWILKFYFKLGIQCEAGGSGISLRINLPEEIECLPPDYALYDDDRAIGFTQRGCIRACNFCDVHKKEGWLKDNIYRPLESWVPEGLKKVLLLDNELAASPHEFEVYDTCKKNGWKFSITQGYDLRCVTKEKAEKLARNKPYNLKFTEKRLYCAWDYFYIEPYVRKGIETLIKAGFKGKEITVYCLVGFNTTHTQDYHRFKVLWEEYGVLPFFMLYNKRRDDEFIYRLARFANHGPARYRNHSFEEYCEEFAPDLLPEVRSITNLNASS